MKALQCINATKDQIMLQQKAEIKTAASFVSYPLQHTLFIPYKYIQLGSYKSQFPVQDT